uniref:LytTR family transcriptional regulator n=1 Tax=Heterorhabditis bacteriophora TaxID=37862 RepID=A0A1I7W8D2_HETBA
MDRIHIRVHRRFIDYKEALSIR